MNFRVQQNAGNFLSSWGTVRLWRRTQIHGVSYVRDVRLQYYSYVPGSCTRTQVHHFGPTQSLLHSHYLLSSSVQDVYLSSPVPWLNNLNNSSQRTNTVKTSTQRHVSVHSVACRCTQFPVGALSSMSVRSVPCRCTQFHVGALSSMSVHSVPCRCTQFPVGALSSLSVHSVPCHSILKSECNKINCN